MKPGNQCRKMATPDLSQSLEFTALAPAFAEPGDAKEAKACVETAMRVDSTLL
jgi:hypothetical protein